MTPNINIIDLAEKHGQTSYRNRADTKHPAYGFTEEGLQAFAHALLAAAPQAVQPAVPVLFVSREQLESHTDHLESEAGRYLPARKTAIGKFTMPLYAHPAEGVPAPMPVAHPHHCTARTSDGSCEECEGHAQAMAEWNTERAALAATQPAAQGLDAEMLNFINDKRVALTPEYEGPWKAEVFGDEAEPVITTEGNTVRDAVSAALAAQAKQWGADHG